MPIQPFSLQRDYQPIPDEEDVTPVGRSISNRAKKSGKYVGYAICFVIMAAFLTTMAVVYGPPSTPELAVYQTAKADGGQGLQQLHLSDMPDLKLKKLAFGNTECQTGTCTGMDAPAIVTVKSSVRFQTVLGFGGAFTEATALNFYKLPSSVQKRWLQMYFGADGIGLTLGRVHMGSCDFSPKSYNFDNIDGDYDLIYFDSEVTHDNAYMLPLLREAMATSARPLRIMASPWSPPPWMKNPQTAKDGSTFTSMTGSAYPNGLKDDPRTKLAWARYISKFLHAYRMKGVPIWSVTPQNEPEFPAPWDACAYTAQYEKDFIEHYLGPILRSEHPEVRLLGFDHNKDHLLNWTKALIDGQAAKFVDGMAFHWYSAVGRTEDGTMGYDVVNASHHYAPHALLVGSEACSCPGVELGNWMRAERVGHDVMYDLLNHAHGWIDWNLLVDHKGGPNHLDNMCDASLIANEEFTDFYVQPKYYYLGHFAKFAVPGSVRVQTSAVGNFKFLTMDPNLQPGMELGLFPCEQSVRQMWLFNHTTNALQLSTFANSPYAGGGGWQLCVAPGGMPERRMLRVVDCADTRPEVSILNLETAGGQIRQVGTEDCVGIVGDAREAGALLQLARCKDEPGETNNKEIAADFQYLVMHHTGEITAPRVGGLCLTAGWPFLSAVAFEEPLGAEVGREGMGGTEEGMETVAEAETEAETSFLTRTRTIVVVMNDAPVPTALAVSDKRKGALGLSIAARAIQTIVYR
ncbi:O-glycosyl hydrolase family 30-domain-containing protein [Ochromonadaceae sp. CCMP2298]|nr:O-glycosyl hydrolase family 30-domain-containing protein [Ochromonadaceae sp. CCMP2298]